MKSLFVMRYKMRGHRRLSVMVCYCSCYASARQSFIGYMLDHGADPNQYCLESHRELPESAVDLREQKKFVWMLSPDEQTEFFEDRRDRLFREGRPLDSTTRWFFKYETKNHKEPVL